MKSFQTQNQLIIRETPGCMWIIGLFFASIGGVFVYGSLGGFTNYQFIAPYKIFFAFVIGMIGVLAGCWFIYRSPITKITINNLAETVYLQRFGVSGKTENKYTFDEVSQFFLISEKDNDGDPIWLLAMELADGEVIRISSLESSSEEFKRKFVYQTNLFMNKQMPSTATFFELEDDNSPEMS
jgi:hypothetical protein